MALYLSGGQICEWHFSPDRYALMGAPRLVLSNSSARTNLIQNTIEHLIALFFILVHSNWAAALPRSPGLIAVGDPKTHSTGFRWVLTSNVTHPPQLSGQQYFRFFPRRQAKVSYMQCGGAGQKAHGTRGAQILPIATRKIPRSQAKLFTI